jgi:hypothetical protein
MPLIQAVRSEKRRAISTAEAGGASSIRLIATRASISWFQL